MSTIGDIIPQLSTSSPLDSFGTTGLDTWTSQSIVMAEYNSISMIFYADQNCLLSVKWSADGINWDFTKNYTLEANTQDQISMITYTKWCQISIQNLGNINQTILRFNVYATVSNNAVSSNIQGDTANTLPEFSIKNSLDYNNYQSLHMESWNPQYCYNFSGLTGNTGTLDSNFGYPDLIFTNSSPTGGLSSNKYAFDGSSVLLAQPALFPDQLFAIFNKTKFLKLYSGIGNRVVFTSSYTRQDVPNVGDVAGTANLWAGCGYYVYANGGSTVTQIQDGLFFGYYYNDGNFPKYYNSFSIIYVNNGEVQHFTQATWNVDRCDGGGQVPAMPVIDSIGWSKPNTFAFSFGVNGSILCYILNPNTNKFNLVHVINNNTNTPNIQQNFYNNRIGFLAIAENFNTSLLNDTKQCYVKIYNYMSGYEQTLPILPSNKYFITSTYNTTTATGGTGGNSLFTLYVENSPRIYNQNAPTGPTGGIPNINVLLKPITLEVGFGPTDASVSTSYNLFLNTKLTGGDGVNFVDEAYSPLTYIEATQTNPLVLDTAGTLIFSTIYPLNGSTTAPSPNISFDLSKYNIYLYPNNNLSFAIKVPYTGNSKLKYQIVTNLFVEEYH